MVRLYAKLMSAHQEGMSTAHKFQSLTND